MNDVKNEIDRQLLKDLGFKRITSGERETWFNKMSCLSVVFGKESDYMPETKEEWIISGNSSLADFIGKLCFHTSVCARIAYGDAFNFALSSGEVLNELINPSSAP